MPVTISITRAGCTGFVIHASVEMEAVPSSLNCSVSVVSMQIGVDA